MKSKILKSLGIVAVAMALFLNTNAINEKGTNLDLASLVAMNTANTEDDDWICNQSCRETFALGGIGWTRVCGTCTMIYFVYPRGYLGCCDIYVGG